MDLFQSFFLSELGRYGLSNFVGDNVQKRHWRCWTLEIVVNQNVYHSNFSFHFVSVTSHLYIIWTSLMLFITLFPPWPKKKKKPVPPYAYMVYRALATDQWYNLLINCWLLSMSRKKLGVVELEHLIYLVWLIRLENKCFYKDLFFFPIPNVWISHILHNLFGWTKVHWKWFGNTCLGNIQLFLPRHSTIMPLWGIRHLSTDVLIFSFVTILNSHPCVY